MAETAPATAAAGDAAPAAAAAEEMGEIVDLTADEDNSPPQQEQQQQQQEQDAPAATGAQQAGASNSNGNGTVTPAPAPAAAPAASTAPKKITFNKRQQLTRAVAQGQMGRVRALIETDLARDVKDKGAHGALVRYFASMAVMSGNEPILDYLLGKLPPTTRLNSFPAKDVKRVSHLLDEKLPEMPAAKDLGLRLFLCPVVMAICMSNEPLALRLLARPGDAVEPAAKKPPADGNGNGHGNGHGVSTALCLHVACQCGLLGVVQALVAAPHSVPVLRHANGQGDSPLCVALKANRAEVVRFLCRHIRDLPDDAHPGCLMDRLDDPVMEESGEDTEWLAGYKCLRADALEALQALFEEVPDYGADFLDSSCPFEEGYGLNPARFAARCVSLRCLRWLVEEHDALEWSGLLHEVCAAPDKKEEECMAGLEYLVEECGVEVDALDRNETAADVAKKCQRMKLHDYLTRGKRQAAAEEAAEALLAELMAEEERKKQKQQKKKGKGKKAGKVEEKEAEQQQAPAQQQQQQQQQQQASQQAASATAVAGVAGAAATVEQAARVERPPQATTSSLSARAAVDDRKMPAPPIPDSEEEEEDEQPSAAPAAAAPAPPPALEQYLKPPPSPSKAPAAAAPPTNGAAKAKAKKQPPKEDPREAAFLLKHVRPQDVCPLARRLMVDPIIASDGYTYERAALEAYAAKAKASGERLLSPVTGEMIADVFFPNVAVKNLIEQDVQAARAKYRRLQQH